MEEDVAKYRKKKESSTSKSKTKSKHKHWYSECLLIHHDHPHRAEYCTICGKIGNVHFFEAERTEDGYYRQLDYDEVFHRYYDLPRFNVDDIFQKFVLLEGEDK